MFVDKDICFAKARSFIQWKANTAFELEREKQFLPSNRYTTFFFNQRFLFTKCFTFVKIDEISESKRSKDSRPFHLSERKPVRGLAFSARKFTDNSFPFQSKKQTVFTLLCRLNRFYLVRFATCFFNQRFLLINVQNH